MSDNRDILPFSSNRGRNPNHSTSPAASRYRLQYENSISQHENMPTAKKPPPPPTRKSVVSAAVTPRDTPEGTPGPGNPNVINQYEWVHNPLPFKNPAYAAIKAKNSRSKKTVKQILALEQTRGMNLPEGGEGSGTATPDKVKRPRGANLIGRGKRKKVEIEEDPVTPSEPDVDVDMDKDKNQVANVQGTSEPVVPKREVVSYLTSQAPPSLLPAKKYCDITGLPAKYTDPKTRLHFRGLEVLDVIRGMGPGQEQLYLALRGAQQTLM